MSNEPTNDFDATPAINAKRGVLARANDPATASLLRIVNTFGGGGLAAGALFVWTQFVSPYLTETRDLLRRGLERQEVLARHIDGLERRMGVQIPIGSDPAWLMLEAPAPARSWLIATADGATLPQGSGEGVGIGEVTDTGIDVPSEPAGGVPVAGR